VRVWALRRGFRFLFGLPKRAKRLMAGPPIRRDGQVLDLDLQLLGRVAALLESSDGGTLDKSVLAEQRRQADLAAEVAAEPWLDDIETRDLQVPGAAGPLPARLYVPPSAPESSALLAGGAGPALAPEAQVALTHLRRIRSTRRSPPREQRPWGGPRSPGRPGSGSGAGSSPGR